MSTPLDANQPHPTSSHEDPPGGLADLARRAPLARAAVLACILAVPLGILLVPQLVALACGGLSLVRERVEGSRMLAAYAVVGACVLTALWGFAIAALLTALLPR